MGGYRSRRSDGFCSLGERLSVQGKFIAEVRLTWSNRYRSIFRIDPVNPPALHVGEVDLLRPNSNGSATILLNGSADIPLFAHDVSLVCGMNDNVAPSFRRSCFDVIDCMGDCVHDDLCDRN